MVRIRWALALALVAIAVPALAGDSVGADVMRAVDQFVVTLQGDSFSAFDPIRDGGDVAQWRDAQTTMQRYRCITVSRATVRKTRREGARLVVELDVIGSGTMRGASARAAAIPLQWLLTLDTSADAPRFISAETKEAFVVRELLAALPRPPDTAAVLARDVDLVQVIRKLVYEAADPAYAKTGDVAMDWATGVAIEFGDRSAEAYCRALHATLEVMRQDFERARALATDALQIAVEVNDADTQVSALFPLAFSTSALDHPDAGLRLFHRAANLLPLADDPRPALRALHMASYYESVRGNFAGALSAAGRLAREAAIADWPEGVTMARFTLSVVHVELGEEAAAQDLLRRIAADTDQQGDVALATVARIDLAGSLIREGRTEEAEAILRVAVPQIGRLTAWDQPGAYLQLSHMARRRGTFEEAREFLRLLRDRHKAAGTLVPTEVLQAESQVAYASRDAAGALQAATRALEAYRTDAGPALPYASAWPLELLVARILRDAGKCGEAAEHLRQAIAIVE
ncbi:MAG TPA: hypothetical protein VE010_23455, partial [Thermoanaerobaculia bacterium]|nr:hypothetical protein [Thermoanaerobaculia bacterium]